MCPHIGMSDQRRTPFAQFAEPDAGPGDHARKRHTSQGVRKRKVSRQIADPALRDLSDEELDDRNARVWATVQMSCQLAAGLEPNSSAAQGRGGGGTMKRRYMIAERAAARICRERYGIPPQRLAEISEHSHEWASRVTRPEGCYGRGEPSTLAAVDELIAAWEANGGAWRVGAADLVTVQISGQAAAVLGTLAQGRDPGEVLGALILAAAQLFKAVREI